MNESTDIEAVILANGDYPSAALPLQILEEAPYVVWFAATEEPMNTSPKATYRMSSSVTETPFVKKTD